MLRLIRQISGFGKFLALTPSINKSNGVNASKIFCSLMAILLLTGMGISLSYLQSDYADILFIKLAINVTLNVTSTTFTVVAVSTASCKLKEWKKLILNLERIETDLSKHDYNMRQHYLVLAGATVFFLAIVIAEFLFWYSVDAYEYFQKYSILMVQELFIHCYFVVVLSLTKNFHAHYRNLRQKFENRKLNSEDNLGKVGILVTNLKDAIDAFNEVFGWTIVLSFAHITMFVINYTDDTLRNQEGFVGEEFSQVTIIGVGKIILFLSYVIGFIFICDSVLHEAEKLFRLAIDLRTRSRRDNKSLEKLILVLINNSPKFSAARFFTIDRSTIFSIVNIIITFLIVTCQFKQ